MAGATMFPASARGWQPTAALPYLLFLLMMLMPALVDIGDSASLAVLLLPLLLLGYARSALRATDALLPHARRTLVSLAALLAVYVGWCLFTGFGAESFVRVFRPVYAHMSGIALVVAVLALSRDEAAARKTRNLSLALACALIGISLFIHTGYDFGDRAAGFFKHPNQLGIVAAMLFVFFLSGSLTQRFRRASYNIAALVCLAALFVSGSKTNLAIALLISSLAVLFRAGFEPDPRKAALSLALNYAVVAVIALIAGAILVGVNPRAAEVLASVFGGDTDISQYRTILERGALWGESWRAFVDSPIYGIGAGQLTAGGTPHSHNIFFDALRTTGFVGFFLILLFHALVIGYVLASLRVAGGLARIPGSLLARPANQGAFVGCLAGMLSYLAANQISDSFGPSTLPFFYLLFAFSLTFMTGPQPVPPRIRAVPPSAVRRRTA